jgi:hypothetical protein
MPKLASNICKQIKCLILKFYEKLQLYIRGFPGTSAALQFSLTLLDLLDLLHKHLTDKSKAKLRFMKLL